MLGLSVDDIFSSPYTHSTMEYTPIPMPLPKIDLSIAVVTNAVATAVVTLIFYRIIPRNAGVLTQGSNMKLNLKSSLFKPFSLSHLILGS